MLLRSEGQLLTFDNALKVKICLDCEVQIGSVYSLIISSSSSVLFAVVQNCFAHCSAALNILNQVFPVIKMCWRCSWWTKKCISCNLCRENISQHARMLHLYIWSTVSVCSCVTLQTNNCKTLFKNLMAGWNTILPRFEGAQLAHWKAGC